VIDPVRLLTRVIRTVVRDDLMFEKALNLRVIMHVMQQLQFEDLQTVLKIVDTLAHSLYYDVEVLVLYNLLQVVHLVYSFLLLSRFQLVQLFSKVMLLVD